MLQQTPSYSELDDSQHQVDGFDTFLKEFGVAVVSPLTTISAVISTLSLCASQGVNTYEFAALLLVPLKRAQRKSEFIKVKSVNGIAEIVIHGDS